MMKNLLSHKKNEHSVATMVLQPEMLDLSDQELEQANGGCASHRHWHREFRRVRRGHEVIIVIVEEYY